MEKFALMFDSGMTIKINAYFQALSSRVLLSYTFKGKEG